MFQPLINKIAVLIMYVLFLPACSYTPDKNTAEYNIANTPVNYQPAITAAKNGNVTDAIGLLTDITQKNPDFSPAYTNLGLQHLKNNEYEQAELYLKKAAELNPADAVAYNNLGVIFRIKGDFHNAKNMYQLAINTDSNYANAHLNMGILLDIYMHELPDALSQYKSYQKLTGKNDKLVEKWIIDIKRRIALDKNTNL